MITKYKEQQLKSKLRIVEASTVNAEDELAKIALQKGVQLPETHPNTVKQWTREIEWMQRRIKHLDASRDRILHELYWGA